MIPLKVKWFRTCARSRLCNAWIVVKCGLHREAPGRFRIKYTKAADWLEATIELMTAQNGSLAQLQDQDKSGIIHKAYRDLQDQVNAAYHMDCKEDTKPTPCKDQNKESLNSRHQNIRDNIESIRVKCVGLLNLCGIKDADIPVFDDPNPVRHNRQSLITNFGTMSKRSPHMTPRRNRHVRFDPSTYADMLIEQLLLAQANSMTESDTSPPKPEGCLVASTMDPHKNNNNEKGIPQGQCPLSQSSIPSSILSRGPILSCHICDNVDGKIEDLQNALHIQGVVYNGDKRTHSHNTTDSGMAGSDHSIAVATCTCKSTQQMNFNPLVAQNKASGSTPELPTSESSTSLDIPFASVFDLMDYPGSMNLPIEGDFAPEFIHYHSDPGHLPNCPGQPHAISPMRCLDSYSRQLDTIETDASCIPSSALEANVSPGHSNFRAISTSLHCKKKPEPATPGSNHHFIYCEPLVVCLPPESSPRPAKHRVNIDKNYKSHSGHRDAATASDSDSERPAIPPRRPITETQSRKYTTQPRAAEVFRTSKPEGTPSQYSRTKFLQYLSLDDVGQCSCRNNQQSHPDTSASISGVSYDVSPVNVSRRCHQLPTPKSMSAGKAHHKENRRVYDQTVSSKEQQGSGEVIHDSRDGSASKRRKGNDKLAMPANSNPRQRAFKSVRQRLFFTSPTRARDDSLTSPDVGHGLTSSFPAAQSSTKYQPTRSKTGQSPAWRRFSQQKENASQSPCPASRSPRRPLTEQYNVRVDDALAISFSSFTTSPETSPDVCLPSREEELLERDAYYCDFTVDRQHKIDNYISRKASAPSSNEENESQNTFDDQPACEVLIRKVEGAESSPSSFVFQVPAANLRAPRAAARVHWQKLHKSKDSPKVLNDRSKYLTDGARTNKPSITRSLSSNSSSQDYPCSSSSCDPNQQDTSSSSLSSGSSSKASRSSSKSSSRKSRTSHPIASSTLILDASSSSPDREVASVCTWPIHEGFNTSDNSNTTKNTRKSNNHMTNDRPPVLIGKDSSKEVLSNLKHTRTLEITAMVSRIETASQSKCVHRSDITLGASSGRPHPQIHAARSADSSDRGILAAAQSFLKAMNTAPRNGSQQSSQLSGQCSSQVTTSSLFLNCARASIVLTSSSEASDTPEDARELSHSKHISVSAPDLRSPYTRGSAEGTFSLVPSDTDTASDSSLFEIRPDIPGRSNTSSDSSCTAARCRPRPVNRSSPVMLPESAPPSQENSRLPEQDLLDSILTDSPKSVSSSGIFAPQNSYNSPIDSVGSHNGYSSTVSSSVSSEISYGMTRPGFLARLRTPPNLVNRQTGNSQSRTDKLNDGFEFKRPFTPTPHIDRTITRPTRNQGVTADSSPSSPHLPISVRSDPLSINTVFAIPPSVVSGPPKIKDKNSLVRKFKKFSSNFYKKTEKIQTLANL